MNKLFGTLLSVFLIISTTALAETIILKSGKSVEGKIIEKTDKRIKIEISEIPITYYIENIESIDGKKINIPALNPHVSAAPSQDQEIVDIKEKKDFVYDKGAHPGPLYEAYRLGNDKGLMYMSNADYLSAIKEFKRCIEMISTEPTAYINLGLVYKKIGKPQEAVKFLETAISIDPEDSEIYYNLGNVYAELLKNNEEAEKYYLKAIQKDENNHKAYINIGIVYHRLGKYAKAKENFEKGKLISEQKGYRDAVYFAEQNLKTIPKDYE